VYRYAGVQLLLLLDEADPQDLFLKTKSILTEATPAEASIVCDTANSISWELRRAFDRILQESFRDGQ